MTEYIEREATYADLEKCNGENPKWTPSSVKAFIARQKAADVVPVVHGRWLDIQEKRLFGDHYFICSNCKSRNGTMIPFNYCFNCGARMDKEDT